jgi:flagellar biosynthetic protein FliR
MHAMNVMYPAKIGLTLLLVGLSFPVLPEATSHLVDLINQAMSAMAGGS